jgi:repressor of nif and glnA expression
VSFLTEFPVQLLSGVSSFASRGLIGWILMSTTVISLTDLLAKDSTSVDPARVIMISSVAGVSPHVETEVSEAGSGVWSCE